MSIGLIGRKAGMTAIFADDGTLVPVSVVSVDPNTVTALRTPERDGYSAVQLGAGTGRHLSRPRLGQLRDLPRVRDAREFRVADVAGYSLGQTLDASLFTAGELLRMNQVEPDEAANAFSRADQMRLFGS